MTRKDFEKKAIKTAERDLGVPAGWWGTLRDVQGPEGQRVQFMREGRCGGHWKISLRGKLVSRHDSRAFAIRKATKL